MSGGVQVALKNDFVDADATATVHAGHHNALATAANSSVKVSEAPLSALDPRVAFITDGSTDNAAAWTRLNNLLTGPGHVYFPPGTYKTVISGVSAFQPTHNLILEGSGLGTQFTTDAVTTGGNVISPAAAVNLAVKNMRATGSRTGSATNLFVNMNGAPTAGVSTFALDDVLCDGDWWSCISLGNGTSLDTIWARLRRLTVNVTNGSGILHAAGFGSLETEDCDFLSYGVPSSGLAHGIYVYQGIDLRVRGGRFVTNLGLGYGIQHYGGSGTPQYAEIDSVYFGSGSGVALVNYAPIVTRVVNCELCVGAYMIQVHHDMDIIDCLLSGTVVFDGGAPSGTILRIRGGESTAGYAVVEASVANVVVDVDGLRFRGITSSVSPITLYGAAISTCSRQMQNVTYGASTKASTTTNRPSAPNFGSSGYWFDTTLAQPIFSDGTVWRDAAGTAV